MAQVIWTAGATRHLEAIKDYISRDSDEQARLVIARLVGAADRLADFPLSGRLIPEVNESNSREVLSGPYRIMYRIEGDTVCITGIIHGARDWKAKKPQ